MQGDIQQPALATGLDRRQAGYRLRAQGAVGLDPAQSPRALADQEAAVWQESDGPWVFQTVGDDLDVETLTLGLHGLRGERRTKQDKDTGQEGFHTGSF